MKSNSLPQQDHGYPTQHPPHLTRNQQAVVDTLNQQSQPLSAQALYDVMRQQQVIGLATVYRALEIFEKMARLHLERMAEGPQPNSMMSRLDWSSTW